MAAAKSLLSLMVVLLAAATLAHTEDRIKMCGRELIRLAVSTCGNSRLRRSIPDPGLGQHQHTPGWGQNGSAEVDLDSDTNHVPPQTGGHNVSSLAPHWHLLSSRIRRSAGKISDICCEKGCSMKELIQFC
ncbi:insulin-like 3 (Leydig cell) [Nothobranchius furzeri]|uniref:Insulin-like 3 n=1 Tax=Nothobranchius furzeri TaxID=105023 RepID=A0A9D2YM84_NOTFU|nr:relaxin-3-like [Nothobranchius furzeri]